MGIYGYSYFGKILYTAYQVELGLYATANNITCLIIMMV